MRRLFSVILVLVLIGTFTITSDASTDTSTINSGTFKNIDSITKIYIGREVSEITATALRNMISLKEISVSEDNPFYSSYSGCLYDKARTELLRYPPHLSGTYIPSTAVSIGENALSGVPDDIKGQVRAVITAQAAGNLKESEIPGAHFVHNEYGVQWVNEDGKVTSPTSTLMGLAAEVVNLSSTSSMTQPQQLEAAFYYISGNTSYVRSTEVPTGDWTAQYAANTLGDRQGNCYGYAAAFAYVARGLGYESRVCVGTIESALGGRTAHAWTEVKMGNSWYIFDTEMNAAKNGGYYKQTYDTYPAGPVEKTASWTVSF